jgi:TonB family protein
VDYGTDTVKRMFGPVKGVNVKDSSVVEKKSYYPNGQVKSLSRYANKHAHFTAWYPNGQLHYECKTANNFEPYGKVVSYYQNGQLKSVGMYSRGSLRGKGRSYDSIGNPIEFTPLIEQPCFGKNCKDREASLRNFRSYIARSLKYPRDALNECAQGKFVIQFIVNEEGKVDSIKPLHSTGHSSLDSAAVWVVENSPQWTPLRIDGEGCRVLYTLPIIFQLRTQNDGTCTPVWGTAF